MAPLGSWCGAPPGLRPTVAAAAWPLDVLGPMHGTSLQTIEEDELGEEVPTGIECRALFVDVEEGMLEHMALFDPVTDQDITSFVKGSAQLVSHPQELMSAARAWVEGETSERLDTRANQARPEDEGEPRIYGWSAMILAAIADETAPRDSQEILKQHAESITDPKMLLDLVFVCRTRRCYGCYDKRQLRVHFSVHSSLEPVLAALIKWFVNRGPKLKRGLPPKSGGARELQRLLSELEGIGL